VQRHRGAQLPAAVLPMVSDPRTPVVLAIDTAGSACSAAVTRNGAVLASERRAMRHGHGEALLPMIDRVMTAACLRPSRVEIVAAAIGPGGFTGIRVGLAAAHGIALATGARLLGISSFAAVASLVSEAAGRFLLVALDSRRDDLYVQLFAPDGKRPQADPAAVLPGALADYLASAGLPRDGPLLVAGDAAAATVDALAGREDIAVFGVSAPDALGVAAAAQRLLRDGAPVGPAGPLYLRPPDVTLPNPRSSPAAGR
jgi:tRNA threonylcarbamoyladenosine biosynthesis protein TsaB